VRTSGDIEDFLAHGDDLESKRTFIFFKDLVNWLAKNGYGKILESPMTAFGEYMNSELALAKEVEQLVLKRRRLQGFNDGEIAHFTEQKGIWGLMLDHTPEVEKRLAHATQEIRDLKRRLNRTVDTPVQSSLHEKEEASILVVLAAVLEMSGYTDWDRGLVSKVEIAVALINRRRSPNTVRKCLVKAIALIQKSKNAGKTKSIEV
jgi:hypothetical protein